MPLKVIPEVFQCALKGLYRAGSEEQAGDLRLMTRIADLAADDASLQTCTPGRLAYTDAGVDGLVDYYYCLTASDQDGNESAPSKLHRARACDTTA